ncbi:hypothetical protein [Pararhodonellum marinum]|uniref:hypothetical protein n=1 Tax=Pararhodonellum marinum TaxID=2755358 RepID=UPI00188FE958|nr:hypothetical protein [Pararhodonellum marinum]
MVNKLLKIEKIGKHLLRSGIILYLAAIIYLTFNFDINQSGTYGRSAITVTILLIIIFLLYHYKNPKAGIVGGIGAIIFFIGSAIVVGYSDFQVPGLPYSMIFLHTIKDILLAFGALILTGQSVKELVRLKITQPFPKV